LERWLLETDEDTLSRFLDAAIFHELEREIVCIPVGRRIVLSSDGGIRLEEGEPKFSEMDNGMMMYELIKVSAAIKICRLSLSKFLLITSVYRR